MSSTPKFRRTALAGLSLAVLLSTLNTSIVNVALPTLAGTFNASPQAAQWTVISFVLAITTLIVSAGRLADIVGRRRLLLAGVALFTLAAAMCAAAPTLPWLIAARFLQGIGAAMMMALSVALIGDLVPKEKAGRAMGLLGSMSAIGTALGPAVGGLLIATCGWRALFLVNLPLGLLALVLLRRGLPADGDVASRARLGDFDAMGTVLLAASLTAYALALTRGQNGFGAANLGLLVLAAGGGSWFVRTQRRSVSPLLRMERLTIAGLRAGLLMSLLVAAVMMCTLVVGPLYLAQALGVEPRTLGLVLSIGPVVAAIVARPAGSLVDRIGTHRTTVVGLAGAGVGCVALALLPERSGVIGFLVPVTVMTAGCSLFQTANNTAVMRVAAAGERGVVAGLLNLSRNLGLLTGVSVLGGVFALSMSDDALGDPPAVAFATRITFAAATAFIGSALAMAVLVRRVPTAPPMLSPQAP